MNFIGKNLNFFRENNLQTKTNREKKIQNTEQNTTYYVHNYMRKERRKKKKYYEKNKISAGFFVQINFSDDQI